MSWSKSINLEAFENLSELAFASSEIREEMVTIRHYLDFGEAIDEDEDQDLYGCNWQHGLWSKVEELVDQLDTIYMDAEEILESIHDAQPRLIAWLRSDTVAREAIRWIH